MGKMGNSMKFMEKHGKIAYKWRCDWKILGPNRDLSITMFDYRRISLTGSPQEPIDSPRLHSLKIWCP
jgi:hypothetical protein